MLNILLIVGARPNFMKAAPICAEMRRRPEEFSVKIVHTGQHYDAAMSDAFFADLGLPEPDFHLGVGSASHTVQTARIMKAFEPIVDSERPDWVLVVGDVNSTMACSLVCAKMDVKVAHVEAGLRSGDRTMPEEINRIVTDAVADLLLTPSPDADENLKREGVPGEVRGSSTAAHTLGNASGNADLSINFHRRTPPAGRPPACRKGAPCERAGGF
jgi:UDP-N-acetylglucosamine 2-epimerase (non-hydrolysing)